MDRQEVFNRIVKHARGMVQKATSESNHNTCLYRSQSGPCLIGSLIEDKWYTNDIEYLSADEEVVLLALENSGIDITGEGDAHFLQKIQMLHDDIEDELPTAVFKSTLIENLKVFAEENDLVFPNA